jgi:hypothetical protein
MRSQWRSGRRPHAWPPSRAMIFMAAREDASAEICRACVFRRLAGRKSESPSAGRAPASGSDSVGTLRLAALASGRHGHQAGTLAVSRPHRTGRRGRQAGRQAGAWGGIADDARRSRARGSLLDMWEQREASGQTTSHQPACKNAASTPGGEPIQACSAPVPRPPFARAGQHQHTWPSSSMRMLSIMLASCSGNGRHTETK